MHPPQPDLMAASPQRRRASSPSSRRVIPTQSRISRLASDESWIEVASQPSSSSLSSASAVANAASEEVITTGLRVTQSRNPRRRRRLRRAADPDALSCPQSSAGSSQEEYDESESGNDPASGGSPLEYRSRFLEDELDEAGDNEAGDNEGDEMAVEAATASDDETALGVTDPSTVFTPQPNVFSHPPSSRTSSSASHPVAHSYFPPFNPSLPRETASATTSIAPAASSVPARAHVRTRSHTPYTVLQPSHTIPVDHDAALRASLSTLLSCAAAARGLPKRDTYGSSSSNAPVRPMPQRPQMEPSSFRLVSESTLDTEASEASPTTAPSMPRRSPSAASSAGKRPAKRSTRESEREKTHKKRHAAATTTPTPSEAAIAGSSVAPSPTLLTWVVGAGVMVLFSALSFSAGYALGREVGRIEAAHLGAAGVGMELAGEPDGGMGMGMGLLERSTAGLRRRVWSWGNASGMIRA